MHFKIPKFIIQKLANTYNNCNFKLFDTKAICGTENKSNDSNDTVNDQDNDMNTGRVSEINEFESDLIDREGDVEEDSDKEKNENVIESNQKNNENEEVEDDIEEQ